MSSMYVMTLAVVFLLYFCITENDYYQESCWWSIESFCILYLFITGIIWTGHQYRLVFIFSRGENGLRFEHSDYTSNSLCFLIFREYKSSSSFLVNCETSYINTMLLSVRFLYDISHILLLLLPLIYSIHRAMPICEIKSSNTYYFKIERLQCIICSHWSPTQVFRRSINIKLI